MRPIDICDHSKEGAGESFREIDLKVFGAAFYKKVLGVQGVKPPQENP